jgi:nucleotide-binding universal stress UspA family protein
VPVGVLGAQERRIAVGVDCSPDSDGLLRWAYRQAELTDSTVVAVTSWLVARPGLDPVSPDSEVADRTREILAATVARALGADRAGAVTLRTTPSSPADALLAQARKADLVVVGPRGPHALRYLALGSVTERVLSQATCPVAVIHTAADVTGRPRPGRIVVGVDGSACSRRALHWAVGQADLTGATVEALAWEFEPLYGVYPYGPSEQTWTQQAEQLIEHELDTLPPVAVSVRGRPVRGRPAHVLIDTSTDADLVVVGNRGAGNALKRMLGSVSQKVARHATVPVVVVHDHDHQRVGPGVQHGRLAT